MTQVAASAEGLSTNYETTGFNNRLGYGKKPAVLLIDLCEAYYRDGSPLYHPDFQGALDASVELREAAHAAGVPVILSKVEISSDGLDAGVFFKKQKIPLLCFVKDNPLADFPPALGSTERDHVLVKQYPSCFHGTSLAPMLTALGVDTLLIGGVSTSGCVRATAIDTVQHGFRPIVVREACGDRHPDPHEQNLFDINAKYGDVVDLQEAAKYLADLDAQATA